MEIEITPPSCAALPPLKIAFLRCLEAPYVLTSSGFASALDGGDGEGAGVLYRFLGRGREL